MEEVDKEDKGNETSSSEYETDEEWELERKTYLAGIEKDKVSTKSIWIKGGLVQKINCFL